MIRKVWPKGLPSKIAAQHYEKIFAENHRRRELSRQLHADYERGRQAQQRAAAAIGELLQVETKSRELR